MGQPQGSFIVQTVHISRNGTLMVSDDYGNSYALRIPLAASSQNKTTTLVGNGTAAVLEVRSATGRTVSSDLVLTFSVYRQFCQPAGVRLEISGTEAWGPSGRGVLKLVFDKKAVSLSSYRAIFGNSSGVGLGFDWSDSKALSPSFNRTSSILAYNIGQTFSIDPVTVGTTNQNWATAASFQGRVVRANNLYWVFYPATSSSESYSTSSTGLTWSAPSSVTTSGGGPDAAAYYLRGTTIYYAAIGSVYNPNTIYYRYGTLNPDGSITWSIPEGRLVDSNCNTLGYPSITLDSSGVWWLSEECGQLFGNTYYYAVDIWKCASPSSCSWTFDSSGSVPWSTTQYIGEILALTGGKISMVYSSTYVSLYGKTYTPSVGWSPLATAGGGIEYDLHDGGACVAIGDTTECAVPNYSGIGTGGYAAYYLTLSYNGGNPIWSSPTTLATACQAQEGISTDGSSELALSYICNQSPSTVNYITSVNAGSSWSTTSAISSSGSYPTALASSPVITANYFEDIWVAGASSPYNVEFAALPFTLQDAATSTNSWSRPGLSPYESYFSHFSDFVSPGNGLVSVEVGTLDLPGRGFDFAPSLVYSEPYVFTASGSTYLYDSYSGAALGSGWALNFPWLGTNYLHLSDGQAFPYNWNGNTFQYNGVTNFVLTANSGGTYTLALPSGTVYQFNSAKQLTSITDRTGSNSISFSYGGNGYVSQVTDTTGRTIIFSYNINNQLASIASSTRTWTLGYTGSQLTSLTDPLNRATIFQYAGTSGANAWLLNTIIWPTGGRVTYTYGSAPVGTEVSTYYATSRNVYYDPTHLTLSQSISYSILNGQVTWSNSTISDGTTIRSYLDYNFQSSNNLMKVYSKDGTGTLQRISEVDSDAAGRTTASKIFSPAGTLLTQSTYGYDNWGNLKYSKDNLGHETWFSYANTDSSNSFGSSGCNSSFYAQTISSSIHDLIVGQCDYQNGTGSSQQQTYYEYDSNGNLLETKVLHNGGWLHTDYTYDQYGNTLSVRNANGYTTYFSYSSTDGSAYLTKKNILVGTQNITTTYVYDSSKGLMTSTTDPLGQATTYQYDTLGRLTQITYPSTGVGNVKSYSYDDTNNILTTTDEDGHVVKEYFDGLGRQTKAEVWNGSSVYSTTSYTYNFVNQVATKTTAAGNTYTYSYDWSGRLSKLTNPDSTYEMTSYDDVNNLKTITDENGHQTVYAYDWNQRLTSVRQYNASNTYYLTTYSYDLSGNLLQVTDAKGQATSYSYDDLNRLTTTTFPDGKTESLTYDSVGNMLTKITANGSLISYTYDALYRLTQTTYPGSGGTVTLTYDLGSNRLSLVNPSARVYDAYDARGRIANETSFIGGTKYQTLYSYDGVGNIVGMTYPDGYSLSMTYDVADRMKTLGSFATITYTVDSKIAQTTYGNGEVTTYTYDSRDRPTRILDKVGGTKYLDLNFTYGPTGNVLTENTETYSYDWLDRLTSSTGSWGSITYSYDQVGNRVKMVVGSATTNYTYGPYNRLTSAGSTSYTYDSNGNLATKSGGWVYSYDYENRLTKVTKSGVTIQQNLYDGASNRVEQIAGDTTVYTYQGVNIVYEKDLNTSTVTKHFWANGVQVAKMVGSSTYYLTQDQVHSTRLVLTSTLTTAFSSNYMPYGQAYGKTGSEAFTYAGKANDSATGFAYFGARFYDSTTGRFITQDSQAGSLQDPQSLNRYVYARDNPLRITDSTGHDWWGSLCNAVSNTVTTVINAWNSLPAPVQDVVVIAGVTVAIVATGGAAAPALLAGAALVGAANVGFTVATTYASGGTVSPERMLDTFTAGYTLGGVAGIADEAAGTSIEKGAGNEMSLQQTLTDEGVYTERGWQMNSVTGELKQLEGHHEGWVQLDLYDPYANHAYEAKLGLRGYSRPIARQLDLQSDLLKRGHLDGITWISQANYRGSGGWTTELQYQFWRRGIYYEPST